MRNLIEFECQIVDRTACIEYNDVGGAQPLLARNLGGNDPLDREPIQAIAGKHPGDLHLGQTIDHQDLVDSFAPVEGFNQQGYVKHDTAASRLDRCCFLPRRFDADQGVDDRLQSPAHVQIGITGSAHPVAIKGTVGPNEITAERVDDRFDGCPTRRRHTARDRVSVNDRSATSAKKAGHRALAAADPSSQPKTIH